MNFIFDGSKYTVVVNNKAHHFGPEHEEYAALVDAIKMGDENTLIEIMTIGQQLAEWTEGDFACKGGVLTYQGEELVPVIAERMIRLMKNGFSCRSMMKFIENLYQNPSHTSVTQLYDFLEHRSLVITDDGHFIAYKALRRWDGETKVGKDGREIKKGDLVDLYTSSIRNNVGDKPSMPRRLVSDDIDSHCSSGFHCGSYNFAKDFGGDTPMALVKINPKDVVSVPRDSDCQKVRISNYEVVAEYDQEILKEVVDNEEIASYDDGDEDDCCYECGNDWDDCVCDDDEDDDSEY